MKTYTIEQPAWAHFVFANAKMAYVWLLVRLWVGWIYLQAGWEKLTNPAWQSGGALTGFVQGALSKTTGAHPDVQNWYAQFLAQTVLPHVGPWSQLVLGGEILIGVGLILGAFTGAAAFFAVFMSFNFLLAGSVSINPMIILFGTLLILGRRVAGRIGFDKYVRPWFHRHF